MTLTGATVLALRIRTDCGIRIRLAEAFEHFRLIGWEDSMWRQPAVGHTVESDTDFIEPLHGGQRTQIHEGQGIPKRKQLRFRVVVVYSHASRYMRGVYIHRYLLKAHMLES